jgi:hypothetical protein
MKSYILLLLFAVSCATVQVKQPVVGPEIHEIKTISEVKDWIVPDTLVIFDLDNTVFEAEDIVAHANFYHDMMKKYPEHGQKTLKKIWDAIKKSNFKLVEPITVEIIKDLQDQGVVVMALTSRDLELKEATLRQVKSAGIDFSKTSPKRESRYCHNGILFADDNFPKGPALLAYLAGTGFKPKRIILVDDLETNLISVGNTTGAIGLHYPLVDKKRHLEWDEKEAERRWLLE